MISFLALMVTKHNNKKIDEPWKKRKKIQKGSTSTNHNIVRHNLFHKLKQPFVSGDMAAENVANATFSFHMA